jgi:cellulose synthase/poly-beta-1,6-N-acetylglucosamine synthase-like glycosyltransferase
MTESQKNLPSVSIVVPTRGRPELLRNCLESLISLNYPGERYEIIVVEDGTETGKKVTSEITQRSPLLVSYVRIPHSGAATARNVGLSRSSMDIVAFIDDDAMAVPEWLTRLVTALLSAGVGGAGGRVSPDYPESVLEAEMSSGGEMKWSGYNAVPSGLQEVDHLPGGNMAFWRQALLEVRGLDTDFTRRGSWREDTDLCVRLRHHGYRLLYDGQARISHRAFRWLAPSERFRPRLVWAMTRDDAYFRVKNYGWSGIGGSIVAAAKSIRDRVFYGAANFLLISVHLTAWIPGTLHGLRRKNDPDGSLRSE